MDALFDGILLAAVYIPPSSNNKDRNTAMWELYNAISEQQTAYLDGFLIMAGDFNHANLMSVFPQIHKHIDFDLVYTTQKGAYKVSPLSHLSASDHITVRLPVYRPRVKFTRPVQRQVRVWSDGASSALQDCFNTTDWDMFKQVATYNHHTNIQEYIDTVTAYIIKCIDDVTETKTITVRANQKPWPMGDVYRLLRARNVTFRAGNEVGQQGQQGPT